MSRPVKLAIFDVDGTLIDSQGHINAAMAEAFAAVGDEVPGRAEIRAVIGLSLPRAIATLAPHWDEATLGRYFTIDFHSSETGWQLVLVPSQAPLDKVFASLTLSGQGQLDQLLIEDRQGDSTRIRFSAWRERPLPLTPEEQARFVAH